MPLSEQDLLHVLEMFQKSGWQGMQLQSGSRKLVVSKNGRPPSPAGGRGVGGEGLAEPNDARTPKALSPGEPLLPPAGEGRKAVAAAPDPRWTVVKAPMLGTFYSAPKPGAPPFVTLGQTVTADDTVGILEVMKLMNYLKAGTAGKIARIDAVNGDLAEYDQALFYIEPQS